MQSRHPFSPGRRNFVGAVAAGSLCLLAGPALALPKVPKKVLLVSTNIGKVGSRVSGTFLMEIAFPFRFFVEHGYDVDVVTPKGGRAAIYHAGEKSDELAKIEVDKRFIETTENTLSADSIRPADYSGVYYPGGHGQFWDVTNDERIATATALIHKAGGAVGAAGHGTASLVNVLSDCGYFVAGKRMTCFPWWAEKQFMEVSDYGALLPFDMEEVLRRRKADLVVCTAETRKDPRLTLIRDDANRLITGSFATSAGKVAEGMHHYMASRSSRR